MKQNKTTRRLLVLMVAALALTVIASIVPSANAGVGLTRQYCTGVKHTKGCLTQPVYASGYTTYGRAEMQGYHCAGNPSSQNMRCGTSNFVYSYCVGGQSSTYALGVNQSGVTRNMDVWVFRSTGGDCT